MDDSDSTHDVSLQAVILGPERVGIWAIMELKVCKASLPHRCGASAGKMQQVLKLDHSFLLLHHFSLSGPTADGEKFGLTSLLS